MEDKTIVAIYFGRNEDAISETDIKYGSFYKRISLNVLSVKEDAEECVSDTYLTAWNKIPPDRPIPLKAYLGKIVKNLSIDRFLTLKAKKRSGIEILLSELEECLPSADTTEKAVEGHVITETTTASEDNTPATLKPDSNAPPLEIPSDPELPSLQTPDTLPTFPSRYNNDTIGRPDDYFINYTDNGSGGGGTHRPNSDSFQSIQEVKENFPKWQTYYSYLHSHLNNMDPGTYNLMTNSMKAYLYTSGSENKLISPVGVYAAMGILAQSSGGESQTQVLSATGAGSMAEMTANLAAFRYSIYRKDPIITAELHSYVSQRDDIRYSHSIEFYIPHNMGAYVYTGEMGSSKCNRIFNSWLAKNHAYIDSNPKSGLTESTTEMMSVANTVNFIAPWGYFDKADTVQGSFRSPTGNVSADYMKTVLENYCYGDRFTAVELSLADHRYKMLLILPDEGFSAESLMYDDQVLDYIMQGESSATGVNDINLELSLPKF